MEFHVPTPHRPEDVQWNNSLPVMVKRNWLLVHINSLIPMMAMRIPAPRSRTGTGTMVVHV